MCVMGSLSSAHSGPPTASTSKPLKNVFLAYTPGASKGQQTSFRPRWARNHLRNEIASTLVDFHLWPTNISGFTEIFANMSRHFYSLSALLILLSLGAPACRSQTPEAEESTSGSENEGDRNAHRDVTLTPENPGAGSCSLQQVYFGYDADELDASSRAAIQQAVECFRTQGLPARLHLTGATDPRGTEEYNIALGDRRAQSVRAYLVSLGIDGGRIAVTSVGEEMAQGSDEDSWARDRNVSAE